PFVRRIGVRSRRMILLYVYASLWQSRGRTPGRTRPDKPGLPARAALGTMREAISRCGYGQPGPGASSAQGAMPTGIRRGAMEKSARRLFAFAGVIFLRREGAGRMGLREEAARLPAAADIARILAREGLRAQMEPDAPAPDGSRRDARTFSVTVWDLEAV